MSKTPMPGKAASRSPASRVKTGLLTAALLLLVVLVGLAVLASLKPSGPEDRVTALLNEVRDGREPSWFMALIYKMWGQRAPSSRETWEIKNDLVNPDAVPMLLAALKDPMADIREVAVCALGRISDPQALPALTAALKDKAEDVREQAAEALGRIGTQMPTPNPNYKPGDRPEKP